MDECKSFNETSLHGKEEFYSNLNMEDITNTENMHVKVADPFNSLYSTGSVTIPTYLWTAISQKKVKQRVRPLQASFLKNIQ